jgi:hypothetical protein
MDLAKVSAVQQYPITSKVKEVQAFLEFCNFYRRFVKDYSTIARPLFNLTMKDNPLAWGPSQQSAFDTLLHTFTSAPVLALPDHNKPLVILPQEPFWNNLMPLIVGTLSLTIQKPS